MISLIVAVSSNNVIGVGGALPWRLPDDLRRFRQLTMGKPIVMGRKTFESIGGPLPGRQNIVVTRQVAYTAEGCTVTESPRSALESAGDAEEVVVIGGAEIYRQFLPLADRIWLTRVYVCLAGDAFFPDLDPAVWRETGRERHVADAANEFDFDFVTYQQTPDA